MVNMSVIISGGAGFIGCHLVKHFLAGGQYVLVLDNLCRGKKEYINSFPDAEKLVFKNLDIADYTAAAASIATASTQDSIFFLLMSSSSIKILIL